MLLERQLSSAPITLKEQTQIADFLRELARCGIAIEGDAAQVLCNIVGIKNPLVKEYGYIGYHKDKNHPMRVAVRSDNRICFLGSSTVVKGDEDNGPLLRDGRAGILGIHGANPQMVLGYLKNNWSKLDVGFQDGMTFVLLGMGINKEMEKGQTPKQYADAMLAGYMEIVHFLENEALKQGKHIRVLISGLQPQPGNPKKNAGIQLFNQMISDPSFKFKDHYQRFADLAPLVTDPNGGWIPGTRQNDRKHIQPDVLRGFIQKVLDNVRPVTTGSADPAARDPYRASPPTGMRMSRLFRPTSA